MIPLRFGNEHIQILCLSAHADDVEIGCGGTLMTLRDRYDVSATTCVLSGTTTRLLEAERATKAFLGENATFIGHEFPDGRLPAHWNEVKSTLEALATDVTPDVIFAPGRWDLHQDHRILAEIVTTTWRDALVLRYEIPKWDGDVPRPTHYVPLTQDIATRKVQLLNETYRSQQSHDWWDDELFFSVMRVRGMECRSRYAEAFSVEKAIIG